MSINEDELLSNFTCLICHEIAVFPCEVKCNVCESILMCKVCHLSYNQTECFSYRPFLRNKYHKCIICRKYTVLHVEPVINKRLMRVMDCLLENYQCDICLESVRHQIDLLNHKCNYVDCSKCEYRYLVNIGHECINKRKRKRKEEQK